MDRNTIKTLFIEADAHRVICPVINDEPHPALVRFAELIASRAQEFYAEQFSQEKDKVLKRDAELWSKAQEIIALKDAMTEYGERVREACEDRAEELYKRITDFISKTVQFSSENSAGFYYMDDDGRYQAAYDLTLGTAHLEELFWKPPAFDDAIHAMPLPKPDAKGGGVNEWPF